MHKLIVLIVGMLWSVVLLSGCTQQLDNQNNIQIVASFYPLAFFAQQIGGEYVTVTQLIPDNTELHTWEPTVTHITRATTADILIYNGAQLDPWFETDILPNINQSGKLIVETTKGIPLLEAEHDEHDADHEHNDTHHHHGGYDPHTWISPFIAMQQAEKIYAAIIQKDAAHAEYYTQRWNQVRQQFMTLDTAFQQELSTKQKDVIFVSHAAYGYLADRYGFQQHGVIGLSADEQPSAQTIATLLDTMIEHQIYVVYVDPVYSHRYAQTLKDSLESKTSQNVQVLTLYLMSGEVDGLNYFEQQEKNLENLKIGLQASQH
ncbi:MAG: zinc ABC transporter substrate-binding protein [Candidatus Thermoplasmatota archaeon]